MNEIEKLIEIIERVYNCSYLGDVFYSTENNIHQATLVLNDSNMGIVLRGDFDDFSLFCNYFEKELLKRNLPTTSYKRVTNVPNPTEYIDGTE